MASTIKVNNIQNQCGANIANKCGTTITLGASGDTLTLACGASQTGFGRTGTVDWDTTAKTASFTAVSGNGYFVNTTSGAVTVTLPATPSAGDIVAIKDYANTWDTNNVTLARNGSNIGGSAIDGTLATEGLAVTLVYVDATKGWLVTDSGLQSEAPTALYVTATGGTETTCGDFKIHTFTSPGTFTVCSVGNPAGSTSVDYLVVAGGGGAQGSSPDASGGGGAGGFRESSGSTTCYTSSPLGTGVSAITVTATAYPITVGAGGTCTSSGSDSIFSTITSAGGGAGGVSGPAIPPSNLTGGSGGATRNTTGFAGNTPPVSPPQGNPGGDGLTINYGPLDYFAGGGGGATQAGADATPAGGGDGGDGAQTGISGTATYYAGGGGSGIAPVRPNVPTQPTTGGLGGGGNNCQNGTANTGGGAGSKVCSVASNGGSGIVIIRYKYQ
jgi:hypothetical protein